MPVKTEWWGAGMVICLERGADLHMFQLTSLPLTVSCFSKIQIGLPFWYQLTRVILEKGPLTCVCVCVRACVCVCVVADCSKQLLQQHRNYYNTILRRKRTCAVCSLVE